jgi:hypothetical protein
MIESGLIKRKLWSGVCLQRKTASWGIIKHIVDEVQYSIYQWKRSFAIQRPYSSTFFATDCYTVPEPRSSRSLSLAGSLSISEYTIATINLELEEETPTLVFVIFTNYN